MTRRFVETRALGSTTGAGIGAARIEVTGAAGSQPQAGSSHPQAGSSVPAGASQPQAGSSHPQAGSASQSAGASQHAVSQLLPHLIPSIRSKRSKPNDGLLILQPITMAIVIIVRFIGATSPFLNLAGRFALTFANTSLIDRSAAT